MVIRASCLRLHGIGISKASVVAVGVFAKGMMLRELAVLGDRSFEGFFPSMPRRCLMASSMVWDSGLRLLGQSRRAANSDIATNPKLPNLERKPESQDFLPIFHCPRSEASSRKPHALYNINPQNPKASGRAWLFLLGKVWKHISTPSQLP